MATPMLDASVTSTFPAKYWLPQLRQIWLPGLGVAVFWALLAFVLHRRGRGK